MTENTRRKMFLFSFLTLSGVFSVVASVIVSINGLAGGFKNYYWTMHYQLPLYIGGIFGCGYLLAMLLSRLPFSVPSTTTSNRLPPGGTLAAFGSRLAAVGTVSIPL